MKCNKHSKELCFTDTHLHPYMIKSFLEEKNQAKMTIEELIEDFQKKYVKKMIFVSTEVDDAFLYTKLCAKMKNCFYTVGIHPCDVLSNKIEKLQQILSQIFYQKEYKKNIVAIGEIGLDFFHNDNKETQSKQRDYFYEQINLAIEYNLPVVIHSRNALQETYEILKSYPFLQGVIHCFNADKETAKRFRDINFALGIGAYITYPKNKSLIEVVKFLNFDGIVYETDAPFLPLQKERGKINTPHAIPEINSFLSQECNIDPFQLAQKIELNTSNLFKI